VSRKKREQEKPRRRRARPEDAIIGANVRGIRLRKGMSQSELGQKVGITFQQIQKYENGSNRIGAGQLCHVATALQVPINALFQGIPDAVSANAGPPPIVDAQALRAADAILAIKDSKVRGNLIKFIEQIALTNRGAG